MAKRILTKKLFAMAGGKQTPRQKMIGMMYLVLTALLALNVSKEILDSFVTVDTGLKTTQESFIKTNNQLYQEFDKRKTNDPNRVTENWKKAQEVKKASAEISQYIHHLRKRLIRETEGFKNKEEDTIRLANVPGKDNYDIPTNIMVGDSEDGSKGAARELKQKLEKYRQTLSSLAGHENMKFLNIPIDTKDPMTGDLKTWEMRNFYHSPLAATVTILSKIEADIKNSEGAVVDLLLKKSEGDVIPFDTIAAKVIPQSNYVLLGEDYKAEVFIAAFNKTISPNVKAGAYDPSTKSFSSTNIPVEKGLGKYLAKTSREGFVKWGGQISMKTSSGKVVTFDYVSEYIVAKPALTVANEEMNLLYAGLDNPISVSVPGIPSENLIVTINNGTLVKTSNGKYTAKEQSAGRAVVSVSAEIRPGEIRQMGTMEFRVKPLPKPVAKLNGIYDGSLKLTKGKVRELVYLTPVYEGSEVNAKPELISFSVSATGNNNLINELGTYRTREFPAALKAKIAALKPGTILIFEEIKAKGRDGKTHTAQPIVITIR